jgi:hypothetical protein
LIDNTFHLSTTASSIVPHFSSTIAPYVPVDVLSSTTVPKTKSIIPTTAPGENIQILVDQLKTCIATLGLLLQNKIEPEKHRIPNVKSYANEKRKKKSQSLSSSILSTPDRSKLSNKSIHNKADLVFEDITVTRCTSISNQERKGMIKLSRFIYLSLPLII